MRRYSLRLRLLASAGIAVLGALLLAWLALSFLFSRHVERSFAEELRHTANLIVADLKVAPDGEITVADVAPDRRFATIASGLYWQVSRGRETERSRSLWDQELDRSGTPVANRWTSRITRGPFERGIFVIERRVRVDGGAPLLVQVGQNARTLYLAKSHFQREAAAFLALLWVVLALAAWVQVNAGLRPLRRLRHQVQRVRRRPDLRLSPDHPHEVGPLVDAINGLAEAREADVRRARQRAADLAHAMKTPIAALSAQTRRLAATGAEVEGMERAIASVAAAVEAELARARAAASRQQVRSARASPAVVARRLIAVLERTDKGGRTDFVVTAPDALLLRLEESDLTEIMGPLLENATRHARRQVLVDGAVEGEGGRVVIEDDGPGLSAAEIAQVAQRGVRLDQRDGGHGLGVSIARELTEATDGVLTMGRSPLGGLRVELAWTD